MFREMMIARMISKGGREVGANVERDLSSIDSFRKLIDHFETERKKFGERLEKVDGKDKEKLQEQIGSLDRILYSCQNIMAQKIQGIEEHGVGKETLFETACGAVRNGVMSGVEMAIADVIVDRFFKNIPEKISTFGSILKKAFEHLIYGAESLSWNYLAALNNKTYHTIRPLVIQTAGSALAREKRLRLLDEEDSVIDEGWHNLIETTQKELSMIIRALKNSLSCYKNGGSHSYVKGLIRKIAENASLNKNEEIVMYIDLLIDYLEMVTQACQQAPTIERLDKEYVKKLLIRICDTFEHLGFLIDEYVASRGQQRGYLKFLKFGLQDQKGFDSMNPMYGASPMFGGVN